MELSKVCFGNVGEYTVKPRKMISVGICEVFARTLGLCILLSKGNSLAFQRFGGPDVRKVVSYFRDGLKFGLKEICCRAAFRKFEIIPQQ
jgi:hypothetical protein